MTGRMPALPVCCNKDAFRLLQQHRSTLDAHSSLIAGATAIARQYNPDADGGKVDRCLQWHANTVRNRVGIKNPETLHAYLREHLFEKHGYAGNLENQTDPDNNCLPHVLKTRYGSSEILCLIYQSIALRLGIKMWTVRTPECFFTCVNENGNKLLINAYNHGRTVTRDEVECTIFSMYGRRAVKSSNFLARVSNKFWLITLLQKQRKLFRAVKDHTEVAATIEMQLLLEPDEVALHYQLALSLTKADLREPALKWVRFCLDNDPTYERRVKLQQALNKFVL